MICSGSTDCGYNGECVAGRCECIHPWTGPECQVLALRAVPRGAGYHVPNISSWGGSVLEGDDGRLYMYAAEMVAHCGIGSWTRNSRIIAASADNLSSPFRFEKELFGVFSHEPAATRAPTGEYVLFFTSTRFGCGDYGSCVPPELCPGGNTTACNPGGPTCWTQCADGVTPRGCLDAPTEASPLVRFPTFMTWSRSPLGPFVRPLMVYNGSDQAGAAPATGDTNLAAVIFADGTLTGMWRGDRKVAGHRGPAYQYQYAMHAANWRDPSSYAWGSATKPFNVFPGLVGPSDSANCGIEDPTLWLDRAGIVHALVHNWKAGGHAASADRGRTWRWYGGNCSSAQGSSSTDWTRSAWPSDVEYSDGAHDTPHRRERPHVVVQRSGGAILGLTTAVQMQSADATWTLAQAVVEDRDLKHLSE
jgi:hypothetical protein